MTDDTYWQSFLDSLQPEVDIPKSPMRAKIFAEVLGDQGIVCPDDSLVEEITCTRSDFIGDDYNLNILLNKDGVKLSLDLFITITKDPEKWFIRMIERDDDPRFIVNNRDWQDKPGTVETLLRWDSSDRLNLILRHFSKKDEAMFRGNPIVFTISQEDEEFDISHLSPVEILNRILAAKPDDLSYFRLFSDEEVRALRDSQ